MPDHTCLTPHEISILFTPRLAVRLSCETSRSAAKTITGTVMESAAEDDGGGDFKLKASDRRASGDRGCNFVRGLAR